MASLPPRRIPNVVFGLCLFWGGVLSAFFWTKGFKFSFLLPWLGAMAVGVWAAKSRTIEYRKQILDRLKYRHSENLPITDRAAFRYTERGLISSLGPIPFPMPLLPRADAYSFADLQLHAPGELNGLTETLFGRFLGPTARDRYPAHTALFDALALVHLHPSNLKTPAGVHRHGGRSLLTHSLLVFGLMAHRASTHTYLTSFSKRKVDENFKLDEADPLIPILALAHDLGKIRKMVVGPDGKATELLPGHEAQAARDLAQIPEFWDSRITAEERYVLQGVLAFSAKASDAPVQRQTKAKEAVVTSDRLYALMGLLGSCDRMASNIEFGASYRFDVAAMPVTMEAQNEDVTEPVNLMTQLSTYFVMKMPVNARKPDRSVGFKRKDEAFSRGRHVVIIDELEFVPAFSAFIEKPELNVRDGKSSPLTKKVLALLDEHGFLFRFDEGPDVKPRPATSCLYKIEFRPEDAAPDSDPTLVLSSAFLVDVTDWPNMAKLQGYPNCLSTPSLAGFRLGRQTAKVRRSADDAIADEILSGEAKTVGTDLTELLAAKAAPKPKPAAEKPGQIINKIRSALLTKAITVAAQDEKVMAVVGHDDFFRKLGIEVGHFEAVPEPVQKVGIVQITRSVQNPDTHVIRLDKSVYGNVLS